MHKAGKNITKARAAVEERPYALQDAVPLLQKVKYAKFDETVEVISQGHWKLFAPSPVASESG